MPRQLPSYLRTLRLENGLSVTELAQLLGLSVSAVSRFEILARRPSIDVVFGTEVIFGTPPREAFPALFGEVEDEVMARAKMLFHRLERRSDLSSTDKRAFLLDMIRRLEDPRFDL